VNLTKETLALIARANELHDIMFEPSGLTKWDAAKRWELSNNWQTARVLAAQAIVREAGLK
jgi:hypothetical protein